MDLKLSFPTQQISTQYLDNANNVNLVINLFFLCSNFMEIDNYSINPEIQFSSDHAPLTVNIILIEEFISFKTNNILSLKIARNKKNLLLISSQLSISQLSYTRILLNSLFRSMQMLWNWYGLNIQNTLILLGSLKLGKMKNVKWSLETIKLLRNLTIGRYSKIPSKELSKPFLMIRFMKLHQENLRP